MSARINCSQYPRRSTCAFAQLAIRIRAQRLWGVRYNMGWLLKGWAFTAIFREAIFFFLCSVALNRWENIFHQWCR